MRFAQTLLKSFMVLKYVNSSFLNSQSYIPDLISASFITESLVP